MALDITISCTTLAKILLHAAKYPHLAVSGVILCSKRSDGSEAFFVDAVPLFHGQLGLAPMLEVALTQIERLYKTDGLTICGYYQANEHLRDNMPDFVAMKIAEKIAENNNDACLIMVDNKKISTTLDTVPIIVSHLSSEGKWKVPIIASPLSSDGEWKNKEKTGVHIENGSLDVISQLLQKKVQQDIFDFDNHLDDISRDWTNVQINSLIRSLLAASGY